MKFTHFFAFAIAASFAACSSAPTETVETTEAEEVVEKESEKTLTASVDASTINWVGFKTYSKGRHEGTINFSEGELMVANGELVGGKFVFDMNSIHIVDLADDEKSYGKLKGHLMSADFFDVENNPTATFEITDVRAEANEEKGTTHVIRGNLSMRGNTKNVSFPANVTVDGDNASISAPEFAIDRTKWNVMYGSTGVEGVAKDNLIDDNILLQVEVKS